jgi:AcrR family transcriptional regulator
MPKLIDDPKNLILEQARTILEKEGCAKLNIRQIAKRSGVSVGTVYNYFPTKKELVTFLMIEYWDRYYNRLDVIDREETDFYVKLKRLFEELTVFVDTFKEVWLKASDEVIESISQDRQGEKDFLDKLIIRLGKIIEQEDIISSKLATLNLEPHDLAQFIISNLIMLAQLKQMDYGNFEKVLKALLK